MQKQAGARLHPLVSQIFLQTMKHLMIKRPLDVDRLEFFSQAETFAAMVKLSYVLVEGKPGKNHRSCCMKGHTLHMRC